MKPMDDVWNEISGLPSPTPNHFQDFFSPVLRQPGTTTPFLPPPPSTTTMLTLLTTTNPAHEDPNKRHKPNPPPPPPHNSKPATSTSPPEYTEKFRRLMKNRESAARSRARKQVSAPPKVSRLQRTKSAPF
ncbi:allergen Asp f 7 homolog isoform X2 [Lactuca sativa]|uniref:allergen Asp f 7 homolog isoform X2 n=1 Tax=Lactuca sativa TaxID=4236 RepID=UPI000CD93EB7|nr:allergen Asp f 7 homolog isoform X2 [Lactuca sativa]